jgi:predicted Zn-dependent peptidase
MSLVLNDEILSNRLRVVTEENSSSKSISLGFWINVGSRDEEKKLWGGSHFLEHLLFKGTKNRTALDISSTLENLGGHLNAFTDRDMTAYYARILDRDQKVAVELLTDMIQNSMLREKDIEMERQVILEEIKQTWDDPARLIHELYPENIWRGNPLAHPIGGTQDTIKNMSTDDIREFYKRKYCGELLIVAAGAVDHEELISSLENFDEKGMGKQGKERSKPDHFPGRRYIPRKTRAHMRFCSRLFLWERTCTNTISNYELSRTWC